MTEYIYKGFKLSYSIAKIEQDSELSRHKADGHAIYLLNQPDAFDPVKFHTESESAEGAEYEIRKLLENYVNFELKNYYSMQKEKLP